MTLDRSYAERHSHDDALAQREAADIAHVMEGRPELSSEQIEAIMNWVRERQKAVGYMGGYREWIAKVTPPDLQ